MPAVEAVFRYPVKSMLGTRVEQAQVRVSGLAGDRGWALIDLRTGKVATPEMSGYAENDWVGQQLAIGGQVRLEIFLPTPRCAVPTLAHGQVPGDPQVLRTLARNNRIPIEGSGLQTCAGVYAKVITPGQVRAGDKVHISWTAGRPGSS
jgi:uncharacterized protein